MSGMRFSSLVRLLLVVALPISMGIKLNCPGPPLAPAPGLPQYRELATLAVPGGAVDVAGGNLLISRTDLSIDTHLGALTVGATYNSASGNWLWSFDGVTYGQGAFMDPTGALHLVSSLPDGSAIPGTAWVKVSQHGDALPGGNVVKTKGGLVHEFRTDGRPLYVRWSSSYEPYLRFNQSTIAGALHTSGIDQCLPGGGCATVYTIDYDAQGRVIRITDRTGRVAEFSYDASGRLATARDGLDVTKGWPGFRYEYQDTRLMALTNSEGERIEFGYDGTSARVLQVRPMGEENPVHAFSYKGKSGGLYSTTHADPLGHRTTFRYDGARRIHSVEVVLDAQQGTSELTSFEWTGNRVSRRTFPDGVATTVTYVDDDVTTWNQPSGNLLTFSYEPNGVNRGDPWSRPILAVADSMGPIESRTYDAQGRLATITNGEDETTLFSYGSDQTVASITRPSGVVTTLSEYGEHGHPRAGAIGDFEFDLAYDPVGNLTQGPDFGSPSSPGLGGIVSRSFDPDRNVGSVELIGLCLAITTCGVPSKHLTIESRSDGRPKRILRPYGGDTEFVYDDLGRLVVQREKATGVGHAEWQSTFLAYDALGRPTARTRPNGMSEFRSYDALGRVIGHSIHEDGVQQSVAVYTYSNGRLISVLDSVYGAAESYAYDSAGRPDVVTFPSGERLDWIYDLRSRAIGALLVGPVGQPFFRVLGFEYDGADRETVARDGDFTLLSRSFEGGRMASITYGNGLERGFSYDESTGFPSGSSTMLAGATLESTSIEFGSPGMAQFYMTVLTQTFGVLPIQTSENFVLGPNQWPSFPLSLAGKRVGQWNSYGSTEQLPTQGYDHDELSNLELGPAHDGVYNAEKNRLLRLAQYGSPGTTVHTYAYDEAGFATSRDGLGFDWDGAGRIRAIGSSVSFTWDAQGRLVSRTVDGIQQKRRYGGLVEADAGGNLLAIDMGEVRIDLVTGAHLYRHRDFRGNVKFTSDDQGDIVAHYHYGAYGLAELYGSEGSIDENRSFAQGREYAGFQLLGTRLYDAEAGRFLSPDPVYQLINQYAYTLGNPVWFWDPGGTHPSFANGMVNYYFGMAGATLGMVVAVVSTVSGNPMGIALGAFQFAMGIKMMAQGAAEMSAASAAAAESGAASPAGPGGGGGSPSGAGPTGGSGGDSGGMRKEVHIQSMPDLSLGSITGGCTAGHSGALTIGVFAPLGPLVLPNAGPLLYGLLPLASLVCLRVLWERWRGSRGKTRVLRGAGRVG